MKTCNSKEVFEKIIQLQFSPKLSARTKILQLMTSYHCSPRGEVCRIQQTMCLQLRKQWIKSSRASTWGPTLTSISQPSVRPTHDWTEGPYLQKLTLSIKSQSPDFRAWTNMLSTHSNVPWLRPLADCISFTPKLRNSSTSLANSEMSQSQNLISNQGNQRQTK